MAEPSESRTRRPKRGPVRQIALVSLGAFALWLTLAGTYRVLSQSLFASPGKTQHECRDGTVALYSALEQARIRAADLSLNERDAVAKFRLDLEPIWGEVRAISRRCEVRKDKVALKALRSIELLRYAEERSIRLSAVDLTKLRRLTPRLVGALSTKSP